VSRTPLSTCADAMMIRSAGSRWNQASSAATAAATAGVIPRRWTSGGAVAASNQSRTGSRSVIRERAYDVAISQRLISETQSGSAGLACRITLACAAERRGSAPSQYNGHGYRGPHSRLAVPRDVPRLSRQNRRNNVAVNLHRSH
jgi:hypothetical protein